MGNDEGLTNSLENRRIHGVSSVRQISFLKTKPLLEGQELLFTGPKGGELSYVKDHRQRLHNRFVEGGARGMPDYELFELVLFRSLPKCDVKPVARRLIDTFLDISGVISARPEHLAKVRGVGDLVITDLKILEATSHRMARARVM